MRDNINKSTDAAPAAILPAPDSFTVSAAGTAGSGKADFKRVNVFFFFFYKQVNFDVKEETAYVPPPPKWE